MVWHFIGVYIINRILHGRLEIQNFSSSVEKYFTSERSERVKYFFQHSKRKFVSPRGYVITTIFGWCILIKTFLTLRSLKSMLFFYQKRQMVEETEG